MGIYKQQLTQVLESTEKTTESIIKLVKFLKQGVELYSEFTGEPMKKSGVDSSDVESDLMAVAQLWSQLSTTTRRDLIDAAHDEASGDERRFVVGLIGQIVTLASMKLPVANFGVIQMKILKNQKEILRELETIKDRLTAIEIRLDEGIMTEARASVIHLNEALNVTSESMRVQNLQSANTIFTKLVALDPNLMTRGIKNTALIALGYWGKHLILGIENEIRWALVQVYECTYKYPLEGMLVFPPQYFSKNYKAQIDMAKQNQQQATNQMHNARKGNLEAQFDRGLEIVGGVGLVSIGIAALLVGNGSVIQTGLQLIREGSKTANEGYNKPSTPFDVYSPYRTAMSWEETRNSLIREISKECSERLEVLRRFNVSDLRDVSIIPANMV